MQKTNKLRNLRRQTAIIFVVVGGAAVIAGLIAQQPWTPYAFFGGVLAMIIGGLIASPLKFIDWFFTILWGVRP